MRPSLTTLAGMTLAAGSIAVAGVAFSGGAGAAPAEPIHHPAPMVDVIDMPQDSEAVFATQPDNRQVIQIGDGSVDLEDPGWFDGDDCPPCGMG